jgi:hypothetical protein
MGGHENGGEGGEEGEGGEVRMPEEPHRGWRGVPPDHTVSYRNALQGERIYGS